MTITALCLTRNRRQWLPKAIACFQAQSYPHRYMLILADGEDVRDLVPADPRIELLCDGRSEGLTIGAKRNLGCSLIRTDLICHWDDDDQSAPGRMADQVQRLTESGKAVTGYRTMKFTDGAQSWRYLGTPLFALGTSLCYRRDWWEAHPFPSLQIGEDNQFGDLANAAHQMVTVDAGELMVASVHAGNSSKRPCSGSSWQAL